MKRPSSDLFDLIKSLSKSEKRYIKVNIGKKDHAHLKLMEAIEKQKDYNEALLKSENAGENFIKHLPVSKRYLYNLILKMLDRYDRKGVENQIREGLAHVRILLKKKLTNQAVQLLKKHKKSAYEASFFVVLPELLKLEKQILEHQTDLNLSPDSIEKLHQEEAECLQNLVNINDYWRLNSLLFQKQIQYQKAHSANQKRELNKLLESIHLQDFTKAKSLESQVHFWQAKATYFFTMNQIQEARNCNSELLKLLDENPIFLSRNPERYFSTLQNYLIDSFQMKDFTALEKGLIQLNELPERKIFQNLPNLESRIFRQRFMLKLNQVVLEKTFKKGLEILPEVKLGLERFKSQIPNRDRLTFHYLSTYILFSEAQPDKALDWIQPLLKEPKSKSLSELHGFSKILNLLIHFDLGNFRLLESLAITTRRYLKNRRYLFGTEVVLFQFLQKFPTLISKKEQRQFYEIQLKNFRELKAKPKEVRIFNYLDFENWLSKKLGSKI